MLIGDTSYYIGDRVMITKKEYTDISAAKKDITGRIKQITRFLVSIVPDHKNYPAETISISLNDLYIKEAQIMKIPEDQKVELYVSENDEFAR